MSNQTISGLTEIAALLEKCKKYTINTKNDENFLICKITF